MCIFEVFYYNRECKKRKLWRKTLIFVNQICPETCKRAILIAVYYVALKNSLKNSVVTFEFLC